MRKIVLCIGLLQFGCMRGRFEFKHAPESGASVSINKVDADSGCVDPDLTKMLKDTSVMLCDGSVAAGQYEAPTACTSSGQSNCIPTTKFKALDTSKISAADVRLGVSIGNVVGTKRQIKQCRNAANLSVHDATYPPGNLRLGFTTVNPFTTDVIDLTDTHNLVANAPVKILTAGTLPPQISAGTTYYASIVSSHEIRLAATPGGALIDFTADVSVGTHFMHNAGDGVASAFDTIEDFNELAANPAPTLSPWSDSYVCNDDAFTDVSTEVPPTAVVPTYGTHAFTQVWRDERTGLLFTNPLYDGTGTTTWADAVRLCQGINGGSAGSGWRLPTQKEGMQLYIDGMAKLQVAGPTLNNGFWNSTILYTNQYIRWTTNFANGTSGFSNAHVATNSVLCVR